MRPFLYLTLLLFLSGCSARGLVVKRNGLESYRGSATAPEIYPSSGGFAMKSVLHVHTNMSHAALSAQEVIEVAKSRGIAVVGFAEHDNLTVCWLGVFCFRQLSVQRMGYDNYLSQMGDLQRQNPELTVLPGLEVSPYAWWTGFPPILRLHDWDVHFTVYNLNDPIVLKGMPIPGDRDPGCCSYDKLRGLSRYQDFVDYVTGAGGVVFQAHPGNVGVHRFYVAEEKTGPHLEYVGALRHLTGFAALPAGQGLLRPGGGWDEALTEFIEGKRVRPPWIVGDSDFHGGGQRLDAVLTWIYAESPESAAVVRAMKAGRMVAEQGVHLEGVWVKDFALAIPGDTTARVMCGESVRDPNASMIRFALSRPVPGLSVRLIRNGKVVFTTREASFSFDDSAYLSGNRSAFYRVEVTGDDGLLLVTNPLFRVGL